MSTPGLQTLHSLCLSGARLDGRNGALGEFQPLPALKGNYPNFSCLSIGRKKCLARSHGFSVRRHLRIYFVGDLSVVLSYDMTSKRINLGAGFRRFRMLFAIRVLLAIVDASKLLVPVLAVGTLPVNGYEERT